MSEKTVLICDNDKIVQYRFSAIKQMLIALSASIIISLTTVFIFYSKIRKNAADEALSRVAEVKENNKALTERLQLINDELRQINLHLAPNKNKKDLSQSSKSNNFDLTTKTSDILNENVSLMSELMNRLNDNLASMVNTIDSTGLKADYFFKVSGGLKNIKKMFLPKSFNVKHDEFYAKNSRNYVIRSNFLDRLFGLSSYTEIEGINALEKSISILFKMSDLLKKMPINPPLFAFRITSNFGVRQDPFSHKTIKMHSGIDLQARSGALVVASGEGFVKTAERHGSYGNMVEISHGNGIVTRYAHLNKILVQRGQHVKIGQNLGVQGRTGRAQGEHLHYEVIVAGRPVNPNRFIYANKNFARAVAFNG